MNAIEAIGLGKTYGKTTAVDRLSFEIAAGETIGLVGPNGSGKTTLLRMLATLLRPTYGYARVLDLDGRFQAARIRKRLGFMPDVAAMEDDLSVEDYLEFFAALSGLKGDDKAQRVRGLIDLLDLGPLRELPTSGLSRGMQQRVALARTLAHDPPILLLDEPAANLDPQSRIELLAVLRELGRMGKTILISSHILPELEGLCNRFLIVQEGRLSFSGTLREGALRFRMKSRITAVVEGDPAPLREALAAEPGVEAASLVDGRVILILKTGCSDFGFVARRAVGMGLTLTELREETPGLERIFMELVQEKKNP